MGRQIAGESGDAPVGFSERLRSLKGAQSQQVFAEKIGISSGGLHRLLSGGEPNMSTLMKIVSVTGADLNWLAYGDVPRAKDTATAEINPADRQGFPLRMVHASLETHPGAPEGLKLVVGRAPLFPERTIRALDLVEDHASASAMVMPDAAMAPTIEPRTLVIVDGRETEPVDGRIYVLAVGKAVLVRRLRCEPDGRWIMISDAHAAPAHPLPDPPGFRVFGRVVWTEKML